MKVLLKNVRVNYPNLFRATKSAKYPDQDPAYGVDLLVEKGSENDKAIEAAIKAVAAEKFGDDAAKKLKVLRPNTQKFSYKDGENFDRPDVNILSAKRKEASGRPVVIDRDKSPLTEADAKIYSGCYCNVSVDIWAQGSPYEGIRTQLLAIQFFKDGDKLSGGAQPTDADFEEIVIEDDEELI
jgi:hypothetical protein